MRSHLALSVRFIPLTGRSDLVFFELEFSLWIALLLASSFILRWSLWHLTSNICHKSDGLLPFLETVDEEYKKELKTHP